MDFTQLTADRLLVVYVSQYVSTLMVKQKMSVKEGVKMNSTQLVLVKEPVSTQSASNHVMQVHL